MDDSNTASVSRERLVIEPAPADDQTIGHWLGALQEARGRTLESLGGLDARALDWHLGDNNTIGTLLYHIAVIEADWLYAEVLEQPFPDDVVRLFDVDVRDAEGRLSNVERRSLDEHIALLSAVRGRLLDALRTMPAADFQRVRELPRYDVTPEWVLHHLMQIGRASCRERV